MITTLHIKHMVCPRCIEAVQSILTNEGLTVSGIRLGRADINSSLSDEKMERLEVLLKERGFELLKDKYKILTEQVKSVIIDTIHYNQGSLENYNFSSLLADKLNTEYKHLSTLFSSNEGITIEKYIILQKIEKAKELISYHELSVSEIAYNLGYSSVHYLSNQFKKVTGLTPSQYARLENSERKTLDNICNH